MGVNMIRLDELESVYIDEKGKSPFHTYGDLPLSGYSKAFMHWVVSYINNNYSTIQQINTREEFDNWIQRHPELVWNGKNICQLYEIDKVDEYGKIETHYKQIIIFEFDEIEKEYFVKFNNFADKT